MTKQALPGPRIVVAVVAFALLAASCADENDLRPSSTGPNGSSSGTPTPPEAPLRFLVGSRYEMGEKIEVRLRNDGRRAYVYNEAYEACDMRYVDESGRRFIIPPGTHCDLIVDQTIEPGETVTLFEWKLEECVKDEWGCVKAKPLEPGTYRMVGWFPPGEEVKGIGKATGKPVRVEAAFEIVAS
jgi:hypothetical protein